MFEPDVSPLAVQGPKSVEVVASLFGDWVRDLRYFGFRLTEIDGIPLVLARSGWSKQGGFELYLRDGRRGTDLWNTVAAAGAPFGIGPGSPNYLERVESGLISYGADTDVCTTPFEMGLDRFVDLNQHHDFIGKKSLTALKEAGVKRRFVGLKIDGSAFARPAENRFDVMYHGASAGYVSAAAFSPRIGSNIALAMVSTIAIDAGTGVEVITDVGMRHAVIVDLPFS